MIKFEVCLVGVVMWNLWVVGLLGKLKILLECIKFWG